jgi:hypothetical protein
MDGTSPYQTRSMLNLIARLIGWIITLSITQYALLIRYIDWMDHHLIKHAVCLLVMLLLVSAFLTQRNSTTYQKHTTVFFPQCVHCSLSIDNLAFLSSSSLVCPRPFEFSLHKIQLAMCALAILFAQ